jgi:hypothetical protein
MHTQETADSGAAGGMWQIGNPAWAVQIHARDVSYDPGEVRLVGEIVIRVHRRFHGTTRLLCSFKD